MSYLQKIMEGQDLSLEESEALMDEIFNKASDAMIGAVLVALRRKGESVSEIAGFARKMRESAIRIEPSVSGTLVDTCGTGGDGSNTINVSTAAAIVTAACGVPVAKHESYSHLLNQRLDLSRIGANPHPQRVQDVGAAAL